MIPRLARARFRGGQHREHGLTMIELVLALTLLAVIGGFLAGGLQMARGAFDRNRTSDATFAIDQAIDVLTSQIATAFPATEPRTGKLNFDGRPNALSFAGLDQGRANRAGLQLVSIRQVGSDLAIAVTSPGQAGQDPIVLLDEIADVRFDYLGRAGQATAPTWQNDWTAMDRLPDLVSVQVFFKTGKRSASALVAIRQRQ